MPRMIVVGWYSHRVTVRPRNMMHATVDRKICEHDVGHVFVSPHSSRQRGIHTSRVRRVYLSVRSRPHFMSRSREYMNTSESRNFI